MSTKFQWFPSRRSEFLQAFTSPLMHFNRTIRGSDKRQNRLTSGSSQRETHATFTLSPLSVSHLSSLRRECSTSAEHPKRVTRFPLQSRSEHFEPFLSTENGAPPPHSWYISGVQIVPSRSKAINLGRRSRDTILLFHSCQKKNILTFRRFMLFKKLHKSQECILQN